MDIRSRNILGSPVFAMDKGENLGQVKDYVFDPGKKAIRALIIAGSKRFGEEKILPLENIKALGQQAITIENSRALKTKGEIPEIAALLKKRAGIIGINVITANGGSLGRATDFFVDGDTGSITCIALGGKAFDRFIRSNNFLAADMVEVFGSDVILAKETAAATTVKPGEPRLAPKEEKPSPKQAYSGSLWNHGKEKIIAKTKEYTKKAPVSAVFTDLSKTKENPLPDQETKSRTKGNITYKDDTAKSTDQGVK